jgi:hypothetical protein
LITIDTAAPHSFLFSWHVLNACDPLKAAEPIGPRLASVLLTGVKLRRQVELIVSHEDDALAGMEPPIVYFSPYPNGYDQVITMMFDDIPFGGDPPKSGHDPASKDAQYLVRLMEDHLRMKMGWRSSWTRKEKPA